MIRKTSSIARTPKRSSWSSLALAGFVSLAPMMVGCGSVTDDLIDEICKCENCGERDRTEYELTVDGEAAVAEDYACYDILEVYYECQIQEYECNDGRFEFDDKGCSQEIGEYQECLRAQSSRRPGPY